MSHGAMPSETCFAASLLISFSECFAGKGGFTALVLILHSCNTFIAANQYLKENNNSKAAKEIR